MKIVSIRKGFQADHSSTSYEFFAIDKPLTPAERKKVSGLSSRARPTKQRVSFIYNGEWNDLPGGWRPLMETYYDVMYSESYDWWTLAIAFNTTRETINHLSMFDYTGMDDMGITIDEIGNRAIIIIYCRMDINILIDKHNYGNHDYTDDRGEGDDGDKEVDAVPKSDDHLLTLLAMSRKYLNKGDYRLLYGIMGKCGFEPDVEYEPFYSPEQMNTLPPPVKQLLDAIEFE
jgi:hypothetical protein